MDVIKLIRGVRAREPLWDRKHAYYHDRTVTMALWDDVAFSLAVDSETARTKWKGLRDTFRGELRKLHKTVVGTKPRTSTNWEYFDEMMFVKEQIYSNKRHLEEMVTHVRNHSATDDSNSCDQQRTNGQSQNRANNLDSNSSSVESLDDLPEVRLNEKIKPTEPPPERNGQTNGNDRLRRHPPPPRVADRKVASVDVERRREKALDDDDFNFLMSLLPQMRCLPTTRNLYIRLKIQELLYHEMIVSRSIKRPQ